MNGKKGFTLLEILIVLVILAVLAGLAVPAYISAVEKQRKQEAISTLGAMRASEQRYFASRNNYTQNFTDLDFDPTLAMTGNIPHFTYVAPVTTSATAYTAVATRNTTDRPAAVGAYTVTLNQDGTITSTY